MPMAETVASRIETLRKRRGLSQRALAAAAGITRQAVGAIESGRGQPGVASALALARALGTTVEELFGAPSDPQPPPERIAVATIGGRRVAHRLDEEHLAIEPAESAVPNAFVAGCDPAVGLLSRHAIARSGDVRVLWLTMTNRAALDALERGTVHAAVVHGEVTPDQGRRMRDFARYELATTEAGWLFARDNPLRLRGPADLVHRSARLANRPRGAGARRLLDDHMRRARIDPQRVAGYGHELAGPLDAGRAVAQGFADAAIGTAGIARIFSLSFVPLRAERCVLLVPPDALRTPEIRALLDGLRSLPFRRDLEALASYDVTHTGEPIA